MTYIGRNYSTPDKLNATLAIGRLPFPEGHVLVGLTLIDNGRIVIGNVVVRIGGDTTDGNAVGGLFIP